MAKRERVVDLKAQIATLQGELALERKDVDRAEKNLLKVITNLEDVQRVRAADIETIRILKIRVETLELDAEAQDRDIRWKMQQAEKERNAAFTQGRADALEAAIIRLATMITGTVEDGG